MTSSNTYHPRQQYYTNTGVFFPLLYVFEKCTVFLEAIVTPLILIIRSEALSTFMSSYLSKAPTPAYRVGYPRTPQRCATLSTRQGLGKSKTHVEPAAVAMKEFEQLGPKEASVQCHAVQDVRVQCHAVPRQSTIFTDEGEGECATTGL